MRDPDRVDVSDHQGYTGIQGSRLGWAREQLTGNIEQKTGEPYAATGGIHVYIAANTSDLDALKRDLEVALWRAGLGYVEFARNGRRLLRTIIDLSVLSPERLIFEAAPTLGPGVGRVAPSWERFDG